MNFRGVATLRLILKGPDTTREVYCTTQTEYCQSTPYPVLISNAFCSGTSECFSPRRTTLVQQFPNESILLTVTHCNLILFV